MPFGVDVEENLLAQNVPLKMSSIQLTLANNHPKRLED